MSWWSSLSGKESPNGRAASPQGRVQDVINQMDKRQNDEIARENARIHETNEEDRVVSDMIEQINQFSDINIDISDPLIRFIIKQIISVHGFTEAAIAKIRRCRLLLYTISNAIAPNGTRLLATAQGMVRRVVEFRAQQTALLAGQGLQIISSSVSNVTGRVFRSRQPSPRGRGAHSPERGAHSPERGARGRSRSPRQIAPTDFVTRALSGLYGVLSGILYRAYDIIIQPCIGVACARLQQALSQGVNEVAPAAPAECAICMEPANFIGENDIEYGPLGYIERHGNGAVGHPDRFHQSCLQECQNRCPMCRAEGPVWGVQRPPGQGGGGLKKYRSKSKSKSRSKSRSKSKSKSKSKSRRYISKPHKSRKAGKRIRHYSSRRK